MANSNGKKSGAQLDREIDEVLGAQIDPALREAHTMRQKKLAQADYERRERSEAQQKLKEIEKAPLAERKESAAEFLVAMRDHPGLVAERIGWLLDGNYGYGSMQLAKQVLGSPRMNRSAALTHMIAAFEWSTPNAMARAGWKKLTKSQQTALEKAVQTVIREAASAE